MCNNCGARWKKRKLSASDGGRGQKVVATASPGTLVHTATNSVAANEWDEVWLFVTNTSTSSVKLTVEWGGTSADDQIEITVPAEGGLLQVLPGLVLQNGKEVRAFAATGNVLFLHGYVNRFEETK